MRVKQTVPKQSVAELENCPVKPRLLMDTIQDNNQTETTETMEETNCLTRSSSFCLSGGLSLFNMISDLPSPPSSPIKESISQDNNIKPELEQQPCLGKTKRELDNSEQPRKVRRIEFTQENTATHTTNDTLPDKQIKHGVRDFFNYLGLGSRGGSVVNEEIKSLSKVYDCMYCVQQFSDRREAFSHMRSSHHVTPRCERCNMSFRTISSLRGHEQYCLKGKRNKYPCGF